MEHDGADVDEAAKTAAALVDSVSTVIEGKRDVVALAVTVLLAEGHLLLEDVPGVGKTMLAKSLATAVGGAFRRVQFTPDLLPGDVTGTTVFLQDRGAFEFRPGAIFANVVLGDEINRASPKTQSALLECMEERQVTIDGTTYRLPTPFLVIATQNPVEMEGTYALPEAQRDRFMAKVSVGYPPAAAEVRMLDTHGEADPLAALGPVTDVAGIARIARTVRGLYASPEVKEYVVAVVQETRRHPDLRLGASPRAALHLLRAAKSRAALDGRAHVTPDDVFGMATAVLAHRVVLGAQARRDRVEPRQVLADIVASVPAPGTARRP